MEGWVCAEQWGEYRIGGRIGENKCFGDRERTSEGHEAGMQGCPERTQRAGAASLTPAHIGKDPHVSAEVMGQVRRVDVGVWAETEQIQTTGAEGSRAMAEKEPERLRGLGWQR